MDGRVMQRNVSELFHDRIKGALASLFDRISGPDEWIRITRLEIDLGTIDIDRFDDQFPERIVQSMDELIRKKILHHNSMAPAKDRVPAPGGGDIEIVSATGTGLQRLLRFLQAGVLDKTPLGGRDIKSFSVLLGVMLRLDEQPVLEVLQTALKKSRLRRRFIFQATDAQIMELMHKLSAKQGRGANEKKAREDLIAFSQILITISKRQPVNLDRQKFRFEIWNAALELILLPERGLLALKKSSEPPALFILRNLLSFLPLDKAGAAGLPAILDLVEREIASARFSGRNRSAWLPAIEAFKEEAEERVQKNKGAAGQDKAQDMPAMGGEISTNGFSGRRKKPSFTLDIFETEGVLVGNAGLVLLYPLLPAFFDRSGLLKNKKFINMEACMRAVHLMQYVVTQREDTPEEDLLLNKILCGLEPDVPVVSEIEVTEAEKEEAGQMLAHFVGQWQALKNSSAESVRRTYLRREGLIRREGENRGWKVIIERNSFDVLLDRLPWAISMFKLPFSKSVFRVEW
ncbi:MAG: contractile injection system tape measure protein [Balneolales bacterium]